MVESRATVSRNEPLKTVDKEHREKHVSDGSLGLVGSGSSTKRDSGFSTVDTTNPPQTDVEVKTTREKVRSFRHDAKTKAKLLLRRHRAEPDKVHAEDDGYDNPYEGINDDPAFEPSQLVSHKRKGADGVAERALENIVAGAKAIVSPRRAAQRKAASKVTVEDKPYISREADLEFLEAHDNLEEARLRRHSRNSSDSGDADDDVEQKQKAVETLEELRRSRKVAWTTSRHIRRVLAVPTRDIPPPCKQDFYVRDDATGKQTLDWKSWLSALNKHALQSFANNSLGHVDFASQPPFDRNAMTLYTERILIASAPWQSWFSSLRQLYRWEDPARSARWFAVWAIICWLDYVISFSLSYVLFLVLENKFRSKKVEALRESYDRTREQGAAAYKFNELISKHGSDKWLDPVVEELGPTVQSMVGDLASYLEVLNNFYEWSVPSKTWATLFWMLCAILLGSLTSSQYSMKIVWMFCILYFFIGFWVASHYPQYRHVVNSLEWVLWDIPDNGEEAMMYLRSKAQVTRARLIELEVQKRHDRELGSANTSAYAGRVGASHGTGTAPVVDLDSDSEGGYTTADSSTSILGGLDILSFECHTRAMRGDLIIFSNGLRYVRMGKERWRYSWTELVEMRKSESNISPGLPKSVGIVLAFTDGSEINLNTVKRRDRAFNCIIGFSGLRFQIIQPAAGPECQSNVMDMKEGLPREGTLWPKDSSHEEIG